MPTKLERGIVTLIGDYTVCEKGQTLTPEQAKILKLIGKSLATFKVNVECCVSKEDGFEVIKKQKSDKKSLKKPMKAKDKLKMNGKKSKSTETSMMEIIEGSDEEESDSDEEMDDSD